MIKLKSKYSMLKRQTIDSKVSLAISEVNKNLSSYIESCGSSPHIETYKHNSSSLKKQIFKNTWCKSRFCMVCNYHKALTLYARFLPAVEDFKAKNKNIDFIFATFTIKNPLMIDLKTSLKAMSKAFNDMYRYEISKFALGYIRTFEYITENTLPDYAHPHIHAIIAVPSWYFKSRKYLDINDWIRIWRHYLKVDYLPNVDVRKVRSKRLKDGSLMNAESSAVLECLKYCAKPSALAKLSINNLKELYKQTKGSRLISTGGCFKQFRDFDIENEVVSNDWILIQVEYLKFVSNEYKTLKLIDKQKDIDEYIADLENRIETNKLIKKYKNDIRYYDDFKAFKRRLGI